MTDMLFDTQKMVERLEEVGVPPAQARMHTVLLAEAISALETTIIERCASKHDVAQGFAEMRAAIEKLDARFDMRLAGVDTRMAELKSDLMRWVVTVGILQMALIGALVLKLLTS
jgi:hypothetical protein